MSLRFLHEGDIFEETQGVGWIHNDRIYIHVQFQNPAMNTLTLRTAPLISMLIKCGEGRGVTNC